MALLGSSDNLPSIPDLRQAVDRTHAQVIKLQKDLDRATNKLDRCRAQYTTRMMAEGDSYERLR